MENIYDNREVLEIEKKDFIFKKKKIYLNKDLTKGLNGILIVYAPWCSTCVLSKDMWQDLSKLFKYKFNFYALNTFNFTAGNHEMSLPLGVINYPVYKLVKRDGELVDYDGTTENEIVKFIVKNI